MALLCSFAKSTGLLTFIAYSRPQPIETMLHEDIDRLGMLSILFVDSERFVKAMLCGNLCNFSSMVVIRLVDIADNLAFIPTYGSQLEAKILVCVERRWLNDDCLQ
jgi:hypothetical protein